MEARHLLQPFAPLLALLLVPSLARAAQPPRVLGPPRPADRPFVLIVELQDRRRRLPLNLDAGALQLPSSVILERAAPLLASISGPRFRTTLTWAALRLLADPAFFAAAYRAASLSPWSRGHVVLVPRGRRLGHGGPFTTTARMSHPTSIGTFELIHTVFLEEAALRSVATLPEAILHEIAHLAELGPNRSSSRAYGRDGRHHLDEVLGWATAFTEGWAAYQSTHLPSAYRDSDYISECLGRPFPELFTESRRGRYLTTTASAACVAQWFGNEITVAGLLLDFEAIAGREAVEQAFRDTLRLPQRTLAEVLGRLVEAAPGLKDALRLALAERTRAAPDAPIFELLLAGGIPASVDPQRPPRCP